MLMTCPECELQVSDKALNCPHCGYPVAPEAKRKKPKNNKRMRLPNGFGRISYMKGHHIRKPYRAMVTVGKNSEGRCIVKSLKPNAYFETYNDAYAALMEYNKNPYDLDDDITVKELYEEWSKEYFSSLKSDASIRTITSAWRYCSDLYDMRAKDIRSYHIKGVMENGIHEGKNPSAHTKARIKSLFNLMLDYGNEHEIVEKNYARTFKISKDVLEDIEETKNTHIAFNENELKILWENIDNTKYVDLLLFQCYSGWRPQEIGLLEVKNIDLVNDTMVGGMKTEAGSNRLVPIHPRIKHIVEKYYNEAIEIGSEYLINCTDSKEGTLMTYEKYRRRVEKIIALYKLNPDHKAHDGRKTFVTLAKKYKVDEYAIKYIVGHKIDDITEKVYTERDKKWLRTEIRKIV